MVKISPSTRMGAPAAERSYLVGALPARVSKTTSDPIWAALLVVPIEGAMQPTLEQAESLDGPRTNLRADRATRFEPGVPGLVCRNDQGKAVAHPSHYTGDSDRPHVPPNLTPSIRPQPIL